MNGDAQDLYAVLGVPRTASKEEIRIRYKQLIVENHPDQYVGMRAKYQSNGDEDLLKVIEEKIRHAEEASKLLNEVYEVLSDPVKRAEYDAELDGRKAGSASPPTPDSTPTAPPEIVIDCPGINFGLVREGELKVSSFRVENKGGPPTRGVNISWEKEPVWAEFWPEQDPYSIFPIEVKVTVKGTTKAGGYQKAKILVEVDGKVSSISIVLICRVAKTVTDDAVYRTSTAGPDVTTTPARTKGRITAKQAFRVTILVVLVLAVVTGLITLFLAQLGELLPGTSPTDSFLTTWWLLMLTVTAELLAPLFVLIVGFWLVLNSLRPKS